MAQLDDCVARARGSLAQRGVALPQALFVLGTGAGSLAGRLERASRIPLGKLDGAPAAWSEVLLHSGSLAGLPVWLVDDAAQELAPEDPAWAAAFPIWLAAASGASSLVLTTAGASLDGALKLGALGLVRDHLNLSGSSPLAGLGESRLGPLFPDQTALHDAPTRKAALARCKQLGFDAREVVAACTVGPALETTAERAFFARAGAEVSAQRLATHLIAAAHAGLGALAIVAVVHAGDGAVDVGRVAAASKALAPALDDLLAELARDVQQSARASLGSDAP